MARSTMRGILDRVGVKPFQSGHVSTLPTNKMDLPGKGKVRRYLLTAAQNNTPVNRQFLDNLEEYARALGAEILVARFTYNKSSYASAKSVKPGKQPTADDVRNCWYDSALDPYICDDPECHGSCRYELAPGLVWCAEMNILPTASRPLSDLANYAAPSSGIIPHARLALESTATHRCEPARINATTGAVTIRNYIAKKAGLRAEFHHVYGAAIVEVNHEGRWWVRQIIADDKGSFYDVPAGDGGCVHVHNGRVDTGIQPIAVVVGDAHFSEAKREVIDATWGDAGPIKALDPAVQVVHDVLSFRAQAHHERGKFGIRYKRWWNGESGVCRECQLTAAILCQIADRPTVVVSSNHDRFGDRWLDEIDYRSDIPNARFFLEAQLERVKAIEDKNTSWTFAEWALRYCGVPDQVRFLGRDEPYVVGDRHRQVQLGMHGDDGPNGARGTTNSYANVGARIVKGHDHTAAIRDSVYSVGALIAPEDTEYAFGPSSWSVTHCIVYPNGKRTLVTVDEDGNWRA
jgi:hypothetical protein